MTVKKPLQFQVVLSHYEGGKREILAQFSDYYLARRFATDQGGGHDYHAYVVSNDNPLFDHDFPRDNAADYIDQLEAFIQNCVDFWDGCEVFGSEDAEFIETSLAEQARKILSDNSKIKHGE
jgi:hypothetical protein